MDGIRQFIKPMENTMKLNDIIEFASKLNESYSSVEFSSSSFIANLNCTVTSVPRDEIIAVATHFCEAPLHCKVVDVSLDDGNKVIQNIACVNIDCMNHEQLVINGHYKMRCEFCYNGSVVCHGFKNID